MDEKQRLAAKEAAVYFLTNNTEILERLDQRRRAARTCRRFLAIDPKRHFWGGPVHESTAALLKVNATLKNEGRRNRPQGGMQQTYRL